MGCGQREETAYYRGRQGGEGVGRGARRVREGMEGRE